LWSFLVPFLSLVRPYQIMRETRDRTYREWVDQPERTTGLTLPSDVVGLWWGWFVTAGAAGYVASRIGWRSVTAQEEVASMIVTLGSDLVDLAASIIALRLVRHLTALQAPLLREGAVPASRVVTSGGPPG
jgi:hypothetical protein